MRILEIVNNIKGAIAPQVMPTKVIAVDGPSFAGKSSISTKIARHLPNCLVTKIDDIAQREGWEQIFLADVLVPLSLNKPGKFQRFDENKNAHEWHVVDVSKYLILDGIRSSHAAFQPFITYKIFVKTPLDERLRRGRQLLTKKEYDDWADNHKQHEEVYFLNNRVENRADAIIET